jgi:histidinol-phosphate aminotransferase
MSNKFIKDHVQRIKPYKPVIPIDVLSNDLGIPVDLLIKLDANENPYGMPPTAQKNLGNLFLGHIYPDPEARYLKERLAEVLGIPFLNIVVGAGSDELIDLIMRMTGGPGEKVINCPPTFGFYKANAQVNNLDVIEVRRKADFSLDFPEIEKAVADGAKLIFLANPNNPDGSLIPLRVLTQILSLPALVVIDEAYIEFAQGYPSLVPEVMQRDNLIVLRTFSKWGGLAGLRLGYGIFPEDMARAIMKIKQPYNVSVAAANAGLGALEDLALLNERANKMIFERERLMERLRSLDYLSPYPTNTNFILIKVIDGDAYQIQQALIERGILIRYFNTPGLDDHIRISIGKPEDNDQLLAALEDLQP